MYGKRLIKAIAYILGGVFFLVYGAISFFMMFRQIGWFLFLWLLGVWYLCRKMNEPGYKTGPSMKYSWWMFIPLAFVIWCSGFCTAGNLLYDYGKTEINSTCPDFKWDNCFVTYESKQHIIRIYEQDSSLKYEDYDYNFPGDCFKTQAACKRSIFAYAYAMGTIGGNER